MNFFGGNGYIKLYLYTWTIALQLDQMDLIKCSLPNWLMLQVVSCHMHTSEMRMLTNISLDCHTLLAAWGRVCSWKNNLAQKCLSGLSRFLNPANFIFRCSVGLVRCYSNFQKFLCSTVYSLPVIIGIQTLVGWCNILFTNASIPVLNTPWTWFFIRPSHSHKGLGSRPCQHGKCKLWDKR